MLSGDEFPQIDKNSNIQRTDLVGRFVELVLASASGRKQIYEQVELCPTGHPPAINDRVFVENGQL
jgi:hypothetical protein